jgi:hypothetical protein
MARYYIVCVSKNHVEKGVAGGFMQANHGKATSLKRLRQGDWVIFYSSKQDMKGGAKDKLQAFTAIGQIKDEKLYQGFTCDTSS